MVDEYEHYINRSSGQDFSKEMQQVSDDESKASQAHAVIGGSWFQATGQRLLTVSARWPLAACQAHYSRTKLNPYWTEVPGTFPAPLQMQRENLFNDWLGDQNQSTTETIPCLLQREYKVAVPEVCIQRAGY